MRSLKYSKFEVLPILPGETIKDVKTKRKIIDFDVLQTVARVSQSYRYVVLDKKQDKCYGIVTMETDKYTGVASYDMENLQNHEDAKAMYRLIMILCNHAQDLNTYIRVMELKNHHFSGETMKFIYENDFMKVKEETNAIYYRLDEFLIRNYRTYWLID